MPRPAVLAAVALLLTLGACTDPADPAAEADRVTYELVERFRTRVLLDLQQVDAGIAALETVVAEADSARAATLEPTVEGLRADRQALQRRIDALDVGPRDRFDEATATIERGVNVLRQRVNRSAAVPDTTAVPADTTAPPAGPPGD